MCVVLLVCVTDFFFSFFIESEEPMELVTEQEQMEGKMQCDVSVSYIPLLFLLIF